MAAGLVSVSVKSNIRAVTRDLHRLQRKVVPQVTARALNTTARRVETQIVTDVSAKKGVSKSRVRWRYDASGSRTSRRRLRQLRATASNQVVGFIFRPASLSLMALGARETRRGVRAGSRFVESGFIEDARARPGILKVFKRTSRSSYPIQYQKVNLNPEADQSFRRRIAGAGPDFTREFTRQLDRRLRRR